MFSLLRRRYIGRRSDNVRGMRQGISRVLHAEEVQQICLRQLQVGTIDLVHYSARSYASAEYWIHFTVRFSGVHAFGYNSTKSELIWMKSRAL